MKEKYSPELLKEAVLNSTSYSGVIRYLNASSSIFKYIKDKIKSLEIDTSHFSTSRKAPLHRGINNTFARKTPDDILILVPKESNTRTKRSQLLYAMLEKGLEYKCMMPDCEKPEPIWRGMESTLDIDHIDGNWRNCKINNLRFLCSRCHSQVDTSSKSKAINPTSPEDLMIKLRQKDKGSKKCVDCNKSINRNSKRCTTCSAKNRNTGK